MAVQSAGTAMFMSLICTSYEYTSENKEPRLETVPLCQMEQVRT